MEGLIDTRNEYIEHIQDILSVAISKRIYAIYTEMIEEKKGLKGFQNELYSIRKWNNNIVNDEYKKIVKYTKCKYLSNLIKIIIITTIKIKIYEYREQFDNIKIKVPNPEDFVHKCYIHAAAFSWKNAYLYNRNNIKDAEYQNNLNIIEENIRAIIKRTFRDFVPFDEIFKQIEDNLTDNVKQFKDTGEEEDEADEAAEADIDVETTKTTKKDKKDGKQDGKKDKKKVVEEDEDAEGDEGEDEDDEDEGEDEDDEEDAEGEDEDDEEDAEGDAEGDEDEDEDEEDVEEDAEGDEDDAEDDEEDAEGDEDSKSINVVKEPREPREPSEHNNAKDSVDNKINSIVDISFSNTRYNEEKNSPNQEISFHKSKQPNIQDRDEERIMETTEQDADQDAEPNNIHSKWESVKGEYQSLSQNKVDYKANNKIYENEDDTMSVASIASVASAFSNITDVSSIKQIHINESANKSKKPSFF